MSQPRFLISRCSIFKARRNHSRNRMHDFRNIPEYADGAHCQPAAGTALATLGSERTAVEDLAPETVAVLPAGN